MRDLRGKRYWLVGASEGLGKALAHRLADAGVKVTVSARSEDKLKALAGELGEDARAIPIDVTDDDSVAEAARSAGEVDGLVYLAGVYWPMKATEWDADHATAMADVNFTGAVRVLGNVVPMMVKRDAGHVVLTGSISGYRGLPGAIGYGASKAGVMYLAESMHADLRGTGVDVQLANPGFIRTRLTDKNDFAMPFIMEPEEAARHMADHMKNGGFKTSFPKAFAGLFRGSQALPDWAYYRLFS